MEYPPSPSQPFRVETLAPALITLLVLATLQPVLVTMATMFPFQTVDPTWRIRVFALFLGTVPQFTISLVMIAAVGLFAERYAAVRGAAIAAAVLGALIIPVTLLDILDTLQVRQMVSQDQLRRFDLNALQSWLMAGALVPVLFWMGFRGLRAGKKAPGIDFTDALVIDKEPSSMPFDPRIAN